MLQSQLTPPLLCSASTNSLFLRRLHKLILLNCLDFFVFFSCTSRDSNVHDLGLPHLFINEDDVRPSSFNYHIILYIKILQNFESPFSTTRSGICLYHWSSRSSLAFPYIYQDLFQQPLPCCLPIHFRHVPDILPIHFDSPSVFHFSLLILVTVTVPLSPNFLSDTSSEFLTYQLKLFSSPLTQASQLISFLPSLLLDRYVFAISLLGCCSYLLSSPSWSSRRCFGVHSLFIWSLLHIAIRLQSICLQLWFCFRHSI